MWVFVFRINLWPLFNVAFNLFSIIYSTWWNIDTWDFPICIKWPERSVFLGCKTSIMWKRLIYRRNILIVGLKLFGSRVLLKSIKTPYLLAMTTVYQSIVVESCSIAWELFCDVSCKNLTLLSGWWINCIIRYRFPYLVLEKQIYPRKALRKWFRDLRFAILWKILSRKKILCK